MKQENLPTLLNTFITKKQDYDLEQVIDWTEKFDRQNQGKHPAFNYGELVRVSGFIEYDEDGLKLHVDADGRITDNFYLSNPIDAESAKKYVGLPLESVVRVLGFKQEEIQLSNIQNYDATLLDVTSLPLINPSPTEVETTGNTQAVIYGEFVGFRDSGEDRFLRSLGFPNGTIITSYKQDLESGHNNVKLSVQKPDGEKTSAEVENPPKSYQDKETYGIIKTEDGREIEVYMPVGKTVFSGGNLENISGKLPEKGDIIRISTKINKDEFNAGWCDPCFLIEPSEERYSKSENLRLTIDHNLDRVSQYIEENNYTDARRLLGEVRAREVTDGQLDRTYELADKIPEAEKPVLTDRKGYTWAKDKNFEVSRVDRHYGVRLESMTRDEFVDFAKDALSGEIEPVEDNANTTYFFRIAEHMDFDTQQMEDLAVNAIQGRIERMKGKDRPEFNDKYVLDQAIETVYHKQTPNAERIIDDTVKQLQEANIELPFSVRECYGKLPGE
jgi:hypothetical protein